MRQRCGLLPNYFAPCLLVLRCLRFLHFYLRYHVYDAHNGILTVNGARLFQNTGS